MHTETENEKKIDIVFIFIETSRDVSRFHLDSTITRDTNDGSH